MYKTNIVAITTISWNEYHWYVVSLCWPKCLWAAGTLSFINIVHKSKEDWTSLLLNVKILTAILYKRLYMLAKHWSVSIWDILNALSFKQTYSITRYAYKNKQFLRVAYLKRHEMKSTWFTEIFHYRPFPVKSCSCNHRKKWKETRFKASEWIRYF